MEDREHDIYLSHNGKETLDMLYLVKPDLMVLDISTPEMSGREICKKVRQDDFLKNLLIVALIGNTPEEALESKNLGANEIMTKPIDLKEFLEKLKSVLKL